MAQGGADLLPTLKQTLASGTGLGRPFRVVLL